MIIQAIGNPFNINYSSCGTLIPKLFKWTNCNTEIQVYMDSALVSGCNTSNHSKKFGWFCESRIVKQNIFNDITTNLNKYKNSYNKIFTCDYELINLDPEFFIFNFAGSNLPWTPKEEHGIHNKNKLVSFLCSNNSMTEGHRYRIRCAEKLKTKVDLYGNIFGGFSIGTQPNAHYHHKPKTEALKNYCFSISMENCKYNSYFTEKITDCFANGVVPIYYGTDAISNYFDTNGIITFTDSFDPSSLTFDLYQSKIKSIENNLRLVLEMESADDMIFKNIGKII
jgi:hypothetical protein